MSKTSDTSNSDKVSKPQLSDIAKEIIAKPIEKTLSSTIIIGLVQLVEFLSVFAIGIIIYFYYVINSSTGFYLMMTIGASVLANILFNISNTHNISAYRSLIRQIGKIFLAWSFVFVGILIFAFLFKTTDDVSRVWMVSFYIIGFIFLFFYRLAISSLVKHWTKNGRLKRRTVIVGGGEDAKFLINSIGKNSNSDIELLGMFDDRGERRSPSEVEKCPKLGNVVGLVEFARLTKVDLIIVSLPVSAENRVLQMVKKLWVLPVDIRLSTHLSKLKFTPHAYSYIGEMAMIDIADKPISDWSLVIKWLFDKVVAIISIILLAPIMIATAIAIRLESKGSVIFKQQRHGFNNEIFNIYKFRSMYSEQSDAKADKQVTKEDARVTKVGKFIRKTSIDELPQLFNVLKNDLSIVGPRPHVMEGKADNQLYNEVVDGYFARHKVKPGITGWAQVNGWRGGTDTVDKILQRVEHDLYYIENWSLLLDMQILLITPISLFTKNENAY
ncbi:MAG: undecaprenyl-phosphate glucose phosphotransferase [Devosiaceae bacterium]|nr:undecaprenyl-phosphate glucose phosphotransferase [Devosiaceae bacterium]